MPRQSEYTANQSLKQGTRPYTPRPVKRHIGLGFVAKWAAIILASAAAVGYVFQPLFV